MRKKSEEKRVLIRDATIQEVVEGGLAVAVKAGEDFDLKDRISEIKAPTLIIWGKHDKVVPFNVAEAYDEMIADSKMVVLENASHSPQIDQPAEVGNAMAAFLDQ